MALIFIRTIVIFFTLLLVMRLMGKRQIGEMQSFELVITLIVADLACIPMADTSIPLFYGIVAILTIYFLHQIVCLFDITFSPMKTLIGGSPSIVVNKNGIDEKELIKNNLDVSDLIESLRSAGYFALDAVDYALYEASGSFSALPKPDYEEIQNSLPVVMIHGGKFEKSNVELTRRDKAYYLDILRANGLKDEKKVTVMTVDGNGKVYLQKKGEKYKIIRLNWEEKLW